MASARTPESFLSGLKRKDSKSPLTTCYGVTSAGRSCRRSLAAAVTALNAADAHDDMSSVVAVLEEREHGSEVTAFFCWQHKDQADAYHGGRKKVTLQTRSSLEDMLSNIGLQDSKDLRKALKKSARVAVPEVDRGTSSLQARVERSSFESHSTSITQQGSPEENIYAEGGEKRTPRNDRRIEHRRRTSNQPSIWQLLCGCHGTSPQSRTSGDAARAKKISAQSDKTVTMPAYARDDRPREREELKNQADRTEHRSRGASKSTSKASDVRSVPATIWTGSPVSGGQASLSRPPLRELHSQPVAPYKPSLDGKGKATVRNMSTGTIMTATSAAHHPSVSDGISVIPKHADMALASALMSEMAKIGSDPRCGYIYMYRLKSKPTVGSQVSIRDLLDGQPAGGKLLLKIGRAENVHRRLSQWQLQCGYTPLLVRSYPKSELGDKVKHLHRVERLIQTELAALNVKRQCEPCGRQHIEWFEVEGRDGVREVDRVIEKWIAWSARQSDG